jgi:hypothetical protein
MVTVSYMESVSLIVTGQLTAIKKLIIIVLKKIRLIFATKQGETEGPSSTTVCVLIGFVCSLYPVITHVMYVIKGT